MGNGASNDSAHDFSPKDDTLKINILASRFPYPLEKGDKLRLYHQIRLMSQHHELYLFCIADGKTEKKDIEHMKQFCKEVKIYPISLFKRIWMVFSGIFRGLPFHVGYFYHHRLKPVIHQDLASTDADLTYCQLVRMIPYTKGYKGVIWLDFMDSFSRNLHNRLEKAGWWQKLWLRWELRKMIQIENASLDLADHLSIISEQDRVSIDPEGKHNIVVLPNGVDTEYFHTNEYKDEVYDLCFTGNLGYEPNIRAANYLIRRIGKRMKEDITIRIAGARPGRQLRSLNGSRFVVEGWVEDIREVYWTGKLFVAPLFTGSGQQNKILEAMACGLPVITTSQVNNAIGAEVGTEIFIADNLRSFVSQIDDLLDDEDLRHEVAYNARRFISDNYTWEIIGEKLEEFLRNTSRVEG